MADFPAMIRFMAELSVAAPIQHPIITPPTVLLLKLLPTQPQNKPNKLDLNKTIQIKTMCLCLHI